MVIIHDNIEVLERIEGDALHVATRHDVFRGTEEECEAEIARLSLLPKRSRREKAKEYFATLPAQVQERFQPALEAIAAIKSDAEAVRAVEAVTVPQDLMEAKRSIVGILRGKTRPEN